MSGRRSMLRLAGREAMRSRGRSALVLLMIALPVMAVTAADIVLQTQHVSGTESLTRRLGTADAEVRFEDRAVQQMPDPDDGSAMAEGGKATGTPPTLATVARVLGRPVRGLERREGSVRVATAKGVALADGTELDLRDRLTHGMFRLSTGRLPERPGEVAVNAALAERGPRVGTVVTVGDRLPRKVVGIVESASYRDYPVVVGQRGSLGLTVEDNHATWLLRTAGPVTWQQVLAFNKLGASVLSRAVVASPPPSSQIPAEASGSTGRSGTVAVVALIVAMALLEVVLLAGPAFAVGAKRQQRTLALIAANGGTPRQMRRVVLASALVLGGAAAGAGVLLGIVLAIPLVPLAQRFSGSWFGPFEVPWLHLLGIAGLGLASAFLAAVVPAAIAARQDVVKVLAGRRGDRKPSLRSPVLGVLLLLAGVAGAAYGTKAPGSGELYISASAVVSVLGMILLIPVMVVGLSRLSRLLPLTVRYAVRDAARHRTRTVPAVAAVAATVVGVVALGIGGSSDELQNERTYTPVLSAGRGVVTAWNSRPADWPLLEKAVRRMLPDNKVTSLLGLPEEGSEGGPPVMLSFEEPQRQEHLLESYGGPVSSSVLVSSGSVPGGLVEVSDAQRRQVRQVLEGGGAVVLASHDVAAHAVRISAEQVPEDGSAASRSRSVTVPAVYVRAAGGAAAIQAVVSPPVARALHMRPKVAGLLVDRPISKAAESDVGEAVGAVSGDASFYVERGYQGGDSTKIALVVLGVLGGVLMLGGTLTATFLALSDARPDLATLSAVGATPRTRRGVAAAYAGTIGVVGSVLGAVVGFVPGIAVTYPLTSTTWTDVDAHGVALPDHFVRVPWLLVGAVVVLLPLLTALVVGLTARSRLPLVARID